MKQHFVPLATPLILTILYHHNYPNITRTQRTLTSLIFFPRMETK